MWVIGSWKVPIKLFDIGIRPIRTEEHSMRSRQRILVVASVLIFLVLVTYFGMRIPINSTSAALSYILGVLFTATFAELPEAIVLSLVASVALNYFFLPPLFQFSIVSPEDLIALLVFLVTSVTVGKLSSKAREQREVSISRGREIERLYSLSRAVLMNTSSESVAFELPIQVARAFDFSSVSVLVGETDQIGRAGDPEMTDWDERLRQSARNGTRFEDPKSRTTVLSISLGRDVIGSLAVRGDTLSDSTLHSLANLCAIALERSRMIEASHAATLEKKAEVLRATLLEAIAHEFKTPLTSVKVAAGALCEGVGDEATRRELIEVINEEANRLIRLVSEALQMARLEAGFLFPAPRVLPISEIVDMSLDSLRGAIGNRTIVQKVTPDLLTYADAKLTSIALTQVLDNALKYSDPGTPILIQSESTSKGLTVAVSNRGCTITETDLRRIFERYYRANENRDRVTGTGVGLAIARSILESQGGKIWAENTPDPGVRIILFLPTQESDKQ